MKKIDLKEYKDFKQYFGFYDVIIKRVSSNKDVFLESLYLSPSSYRRAKNTGNKIGKQILNDLCKHFNYKMMEEHQIGEYMYDLQVPNLSPGSSSTLLSWKEKLFGRRR